MSKKTGRNAPCPCNSGKKFKHCCLNNATNGFMIEQPEKKRTNNTLKYIESYDSKDILHLIVGLQLIPENHGKNLRIEELARHLVLNLKKTGKSDIESFKSYLAEDYASNPMEDLPENLYSENFVFFGGNYTVLNGIHESPVEILRNLTEVIFIVNNELPERFVEKVYSGVTLILELGKLVLDKVGISGNVSGSSEDSTLQILREDIDFSISIKQVEDICKKRGIDPSVIKEFVASPQNERFYDSDPDLNPLLYYPIIWFQDRFYFLMIHSQVFTLIEYILRLSNLYSCNEYLLKIYHEHIWHKLWGACDSIGWKLTDIKLPENQFESHVKERIFQLDINRLAYVSYLHNSFTKERSDESEEDIVFPLVVNERYEQVVTELKGRPEFSNFKFLTLVIYENLGRTFMMAFEGAQDKEYRLSFSAHQFLQLSQTEKWDVLSLWKFGKVYEKFYQSSQSISSTLDLYAVYKWNDSSFYLNDDAKTNFLVVVPGDGSKLIKDGKLKQNCHGSPALVEDRLAYLSVVRASDFAPLYRLVSAHAEYQTLCLEVFDFPLWLTGRQINKLSGRKTIRDYAEGIGFWLFKLSKGIEKVLNEQIKEPLEIEIEFEEEIFLVNPIEGLPENDKDVFYLFHYDNKRNSIKVIIPFSSVRSLFGSTNEGERKLMSSILESFNLIEGVEFETQFIEKVINEFMPLGNAKMILMYATTNNMLLDNRWLIKPHYTTSAETNLLLDELPELLKEKITIPKQIESVKQKRDFFNKATSVLLDKLSNEIKGFRKEALLEGLLQLNETFIWKRENNKTIIPAQIICFGENEEKVKEISENEKKLSNTSLAVRCLIEYVASMSTAGAKDVGLDDIDILLAIMHEIITYGFFSDAIYFGMANPNVGLLKSGRIGISKEFFDEKLVPFNTAHIREDIDEYLNNFEERFESLEKVTTAETGSGEKVTEVMLDDAFLSDWGISFINIYKFCYSCAILCIESSASTITIKKHDLQNKLVDEFELPKDEVENAIKRFSLSIRNDFLLAPQGFKNTEVFPWKYNREFSLARRFLIKFDIKDEVHLTWGFRNAIAAEKQLYHLLVGGKLKNGGKEIEKLLGIFRERKGKLYRDKVKDWLSTFEELEVIEHEVIIAPNGHLEADKDYGDLDVLLYNTKSRMLISIECKNTNKARNIHEMKQEMDNYLGRVGQTGMIDKHVERHSWIKNNKDKIRELMKIKGTFLVKSFILTSEVIPTTYIKSESLKLPIISFPDLKREGLKLFL